MKIFDLIDFSASTADIMEIIDALLWAINDFFAYLGIQLFAPEK